MGRSATLPSHRTAGTSRTAARPAVALRVVHSRPRRRVRAATPPMFLAIEWSLLTMLGAIALALATG